jgi:hypothetical protein
VIGELKAGTDTFREPKSSIAEILAYSLHDEAHLDPLRLDSALLVQDKSPTKHTEVSTPTLEKLSPAQKPAPSA